MHPIVESRREQVAALCRSRGVKRLELFGSAARDDFDEARSDIDFLVEFGEERAHRGLAAYFDLKSDLEGLFGRPVDLVTVGTVRNPYVRATIEQDRQMIYAA
jgi:predicted nucleotidyltransferase